MNMKYLRIKNVENYQIKTKKENICIANRINRKNTCVWMTIKENMCDHGMIRK